MLVVGNTAEAGRLSELLNAEYIPEPLFELEKIPFHPGVLIDASIDTGSVAKATGRAIVSAMFGVKYVTVTYLDDPYALFKSMRRSVLRMAPNTLMVSTGYMVVPGRNIEVHPYTDGSKKMWEQWWSLIHVEELRNLLMKNLELRGHLVIAPPDMVSSKIISSLNINPARITNGALSDKWSFRNSFDHIDVEATSIKELLKTI